MALAWLVWNLILLGWDIHEEMDRNAFRLGSLASIIDGLIYWYVGSAVVYCAVWLSIVFPLDILVPDDSRMRHPLPATLIGYFAGFMVMEVFWNIEMYLTGVNLTLQPVLDSVSAGFLINSTAGATGIVAANWIGYAARNLKQEA